jgi:hypothetical protein
MDGNRHAAGIVSVLGGGAIAAFVVLSTLATGHSAEAAPPRQQGQQAADAGVPVYIAAASQGQVTPPDLEDVEHMCALLTSCDKLPFAASMLPTSVPSCVQSFMNVLTSPEAVKFSLTIRDCGLQANSCAELRSCALREAAPDACVGRGKSGPVGICDLDGRAINCFHEKIVGVRDCPRGGEQCVVREGQAECALGPCTGENKEGAPPTCSASGMRVLQCDHGKLASLDCAAFGLRCSVADGHPGCSPPTATCSGAAKRCEGNVSVGCMHGHEVRVDCGASGLTCNPTPGSLPVGACVAPPPAAAAERCDPKEAARCDGASIRYCFAGRKRSYFCKSLGFNACLKDGNAIRCGG